MLLNLVQTEVEGLIKGGVAHGGYWLTAHSLTWGDETKVDSKHRYRVTERLSLSVKNLLADLFDKEVVCAPDMHFPFVV